MKDAIIIGAGPAGLYCAGLLEKKGLDVLVVEEHKEIGMPVKCSGLISWNLENFVEIKGEFLERIVNKAVINSPRGFCLKLEKEKPVYVIDRHAFDSFLGNKLKSDIMLGCKAEDINIRDEHAEVVTKKGRFKSRIIIGADGPLSVVARKFNVKTPFRIGIFGYADENPENDCVELFYDKRFTDGFLWKIPRKDSVEYGILGSRPAPKMLEKFFGKNIKAEAGLIPGRPAKRTYFERCLLIGDAAGLIKPWSGGGVIYSLLSASIAADVIDNSYEKNDFSSSALKAYEDRWKKKLMAPIRIGLLWNEFVKRSNNLMLDAFFRAASLVGLNRLDMDFVFRMQSGKES